MKFSLFFSCKRLYFPLLQGLGEGSRVVKKLSSGCSGKESSYQFRRCRRLRFDPWSGRSSGEGSGNPGQYSCLGNPRDRKAWQLQSTGIAKESEMT